MQLCVASPLVLAGATACSETKSFRLGIYQHPGHEALYFSEHFGLLPRHVQLNKSQSAEHVLSAMRSGQLDAATLALDEVISCLQAGIPLKIITVLSQCCGAHSFIAKPGIPDLEALKGKVIAIEQRASSELLLQYVLDKAGLQRSDVEIAYLPKLKQLMAWQEGQIDAAISCPLVSIYMERSGARRLFHPNSSIPGNYQVLAVRKDSTSWLSDTEARLLDSYYLSLRQLQLFYGDSIRRTAYWRQLSLKETQRYFNSVQRPGVLQTMQLMTESPALGELLTKLSHYLPDQTLHSAADALFDATALRQLVLN